MAFPWRCLYLLVWGKLGIYKYLLIWLIAEGSCILVGVTYNGKDKNGNDLWNGCANIKFKQHELVTNTVELIGSFHLTTNDWVAKYVFKRLKWLGSKTASFVISMVFLAFWHGFYPGYYMFFFVEFICVQFEHAVSRFVKRSTILSRFCSKPSYSPLVWAIKKFYAQMCISYNFVALNLLTYKSMMQVYSSLYFCVHILFIAVPLLDLLLRNMIPRKKVSKTYENGLNGQTSSKSNKSE